MQQKFEKVSKSDFSYHRDNCGYMLQLSIVSSQTNGEPETAIYRRTNSPIIVGKIILYGDNPVYGFKESEFFVDSSLLHPNVTKQTILSTIEDLVSDFTYYDRKESDLTMDNLNQAVASGEITIQEMVDEFRKGLEGVFNDPVKPKDESDEV